jgi:hypothetical protein
VSDARGAEEFLRLSKALKAAGHTGFRKELTAGLRLGAKPLIPLNREAARKTLPKRGGLNERVAKTPQRIQIRTGAVTAGVRIVVPNKKSGAKTTDEGFVRHPVFGNRKTWKQTKTQPGWFSDTNERNAPLVIPSLEAAMQRVRLKVLADG